jgi:hypothetical protein
LGLQSSTSPTNAVGNTLYGVDGDGTPSYNIPSTPYFSYSDPNNVPYPTIWASQTNNAGVTTNYVAAGLTMPQTGMKFLGNVGLYMNKNLQISPLI